MWEAGQELLVNVLVETGDHTLSFADHAEAVDRAGVVIGKRPAGELRLQRAPA